MKNIQAIIHHQKSSCDNLKEIQISTNRVYLNKIKSFSFTTFTLKTDNTELPLCLTHFTFNWETLATHFSIRSFGISRAAFRICRALGPIKKLRRRRFRVRSAFRGGSVLLYVSFRCDRQ